jgi:methylmalonyl-CoA mutase C-terminal domain/subunit
LFKQRGIEDIPIIVGGIIPDGDIPKLKKMGIKEVFGPGTTTAQVVSCVQDLISNKGHPPKRK